MGKAGISGQFPLEGVILGGMGIFFCGRAGAGYLQQRFRMQNRICQAVIHYCLLYTSNDTYEPGSTFKIITAAAGLEAGAVRLEDRFSCPGFRIVEDRKIRCHKIGGHGGETFLQGVMNSCNPVFIDVGQRPVSYTHLVEA